MDLFANTSVPSLHIALRGLGERQESIGQNIANVSVPGFKSQKVNFEENLQKALQYQQQKHTDLVKTNPKHMDFETVASSVEETQIETESDMATEIHSAGNNVDIDAEMLNLARTGLQYRAISQMSRRQLDQLRSVIRGGM